MMMKFEMLISAETVDDDSDTMTDEEWKEELGGIIESLCLYINRRYRQYVKNAEGEVALEGEGHYEWEERGGGR